MMKDSERVFLSGILLAVQANAGPGVHSMNIRVGGGGVPLELQNPDYFHTLLQSKS